MIEAQYEVLLGETCVGVLHQRGDYVVFEVLEGYAEDPRRPILGLFFEEDLRARHSSRLRLPAWFSNLLPEGQLREWIADDRGVSPDREMELLAQVGHDLPGGATVVPVAPGARQRLLDVTIGRAADQTQPAIPASGEQRQPVWRFSLAGVALKFSMLRVHDRLTLPASGRGGDWIVKLPDHRYDGVPQNEFLMMSLARRVGIDVPDIELVHRDELSDLPDRAWPRGQVWAYAIRRFDRGPNREKIHIEDLAQVCGVYPRDKYRGNFETVGALVFRRHDLEALREFVRRLAFCIVVENGDAHLKNWSLIYRDPRRPTLAPAYDLVSTAPYRAREDGPEELGLKFGGTKRIAAQSLGAFARLERILGATGADLVDVAHAVTKDVHAAWRELRADADDALRSSVDESVLRGSRSLG